MRCFAALMVALLIVAGPGVGHTMADTYEVPNLSTDLDHVINNVAGPGDFVRVSNNDNDNEPYDPITMQAGVTVYA